MKICRECGFIKSDNYKECPECQVKLEKFEEFEGGEE
jgi:rubrerythrin